MTHDEIERWQRVDALFEEALALPAAERAAFLAARCGGDDALRQQVEGLLQAHDEAQTFLETAAPSPEALGAPGATGPGEAGPAGGVPVERRIGAYRLVREIGSGGMGEVYLAERADGQFVQRVALKRIRGGFASAATLDRFRLERQILARLEHPHITRLIDGGVDETGCPYLVMEYVEGIPLTQYCDEQRLGIEQRLALFTTVCHAVHHAHRNLVVHRDLKPSNILVVPPSSKTGGLGQVKLLDFGIAKLVDDAAEAFPVVVTQSDMRLMTPGYASPEQVRGEAITTASDVYTLGVILYELLTGRLPYRFPSRLLHDVERVIAETEPERPSTAVGRPSVAVTSPVAVGQARGTTPERLRRRLRGDLDTIVLMALRKEPERRYASAEQLAEDVERYLTGRPVRARPDTFAYRAGKFVRRNRLGVAAAAAVLVALVGGLGAAAWQARIATREAAKARQINAFLLDMLASPNPQERGRAVTVAEVLDAAAAQLDEQLRDEPEVEADIRGTLGMTYRSLGLYEEAERHQRRAVELRRRVQGPRHPATAAEMNRLGMLYVEMGRPAEAEAVYREALAVEREVLAPGDERLGQLMGNLALALQEQGRYDEADTLYREATAVLWPDTSIWNSDVYSVLNGHATLLHAMGRLPEAADRLRAILDRTRRAGVDNPYPIGLLLNNLSQVLQLQGEYAEAEALLREAVALNEKRLGADHPESALYLANLGSLLQDRGETDEAEALFRRALDIQRRALGPDHPDVGQTLSNLGSVLRERGDYAAAEPVQRESVRILESSLGATHPVTAIVRMGLGRILYEQGRLAAAEALFRSSLLTLAEALPGHVYLARTQVALGQLLVDRGAAAEAEPLLREGLRIREAALASGDWQVAHAQSALGRALAHLGRFAEAEPLLLEGYATLRDKRPPADPDLRRARAGLVHLYEAWGRPGQAAPYRD